jgi:hypothetical protein
LGSPLEVDVDSRRLDEHHELTLAVEVHIDEYATA